MSGDGEVRQLVVHPELWDFLMLQLRMRGLRVVPMPPEAQGDDDDLPTFVIIPADGRGEA